MDRIEERVNFKKRFILYRLLTPYEQKYNISNSILPEKLAKITKNLNVYANRKYNISMKKIFLEEKIKKMISELKAYGYDAYAVGGCVRDFLMERKPYDIDITTSATPDDVKHIFSGYRVIPTGEKHGTVTVVMDGEHIEVTTFRTDSKYSDHRHPDKIEFASRIEDDLSRRDFTINAMAYNDERGMVDPFSGQDDIEKKIIRAVGDPDKRFSEDALRIMRALRFASKSGFDIEEKTADAMRRQKRLLNSVSVERLYSELMRILCGQNAVEVLRNYHDIVGEVIPEIVPMVGFEQHNRHHIYDVFEHTLHVVGAAPDTPLLRMAALLHDCGKPDTYKVDEFGEGHFDGHASKSAEKADLILRRFHADNDSRYKITELIRLHGREILPTKRAVKRALNKIGEELFFMLLDLKNADDSAKLPEYTKRREETEAIRAIAKKIADEKECYSETTLAVNGNDLKLIGMKEGQEIGKMLKILLDDVIDGETENDKEKLISRAKEIYKGIAP